MLVPAHYLVPFSRLGPYDREQLDRVAYRSREFTEQWAHEASIIPVETWPLLAHHRREFRLRPWGFDRFMEKHSSYANQVLKAVKRRGPLTAEDVPSPDGAPRTIPKAWHRAVPRATMEAWFSRGVLAVADRRPNFARVYDLAERVLPRAVRKQKVGREDAQRSLLLKAAASCGIATVQDLADYYRMSPREARPRILELVEDGKLAAVRVEQWKEPAYLHPDAEPAATVERAALLSPFDPLIWFRPRTERLFGFHYRIEIYVPAPKRKWGYYVLPFLMGDQLVARVDLKAERTERRLLVQASYAEAGVNKGEVAAALARELRTLALWLSLSDVSVARKGNMASALSSAYDDQR